MIKRWIQKALKARPGSLHHMLDIDKKDKIPLALLDKIIKAKPGNTIRNPTSKGKRMIKVTRLMERRAILARNLKKINKKKRN